MPKSLMIFILAVLISGTVNASTFTHTECLTKSGQLRPCFVTVDEKNVTIMYTGRRDGDQNATIPGKSIKSMYLGSHSRDKTDTDTELLAALSKKKRDIIGIVYMEGKTKKRVVIQVSKRETMALQQELQTVSGKTVK